MSGPRPSTTTHEDPHRRKINPFELEEDDHWNDDEEDGLLLAHFNEKVEPTKHIKKRRRKRLSWRCFVGTVGVFLIGFVVVSTQRSQQDQTDSRPTSSINPGDSSSTTTNTTAPTAAPADTDNHATLVTILGERHSGTEWVRSTLQDCFPYPDFGDGIVRPGYWFQEKQLNNTMKQKEPNVLVVVVRHPYDWTFAMRENPLYAPNHRFNSTHPLEWGEFLSKPWYPRNEETSVTVPSNSSCQFGFSPHQVAPCRAQSPPALYELNSKGESFPNIIELRKAKLKYWWDEVTQVHKNTIIEYFNIENPIAALITRLEDILHHQPQCDVKQLDHRAPIIGNDDTSPVSIPSDAVQILYQLVDWDLEKKAGYLPPN